MEEVAGRLAAEVKDSSVFSILARPWLINKVTCGSLVTMMDTSSSSYVVVTVDICLIALLIANIILFLPVIFSDLSGLFDDQLGDVFNQMQDKLDRVENKLYLDEKLTEFENISHIQNTVDVIKNVTNFDINLETLLNLTKIEQPLNIIKDIGEIIKNITEEAKAREAFEESLNIQRVPIDIYKFPFGEYDPFGAAYVGFEAATDEVIDLSEANKQERLAFYRLPRSFQQRPSNLEMIVLQNLKILFAAVKIEFNEVNLTE